MKVKETLIVVLFCTIFTKCHGAIRFANYYNNHMVLQRAPQRANIWGFGTAGVAVSVKIDGLVVSTINVGADGVWKTLLPATTAGGPHNVSVTSSDGGAALSDVMFGDVWVCSGQSNMEYTLSGISNYTAYIDAAKSLHNIRLFRTNHKATDVPQVEPVVNTQWTIPDQHDAHTRVFSAVCLMYALELAPHLQRPLGLVETNWGGTPVEAWSSPDALAKCPQHKRRAVNAHSPSALWNGMVAPLLPMTIYGAIWYQGEANAGKAHLYACQFRAMIEDWRAKFHAKSHSQTSNQFPFGFVQLAPFRNGSSSLGFSEIRWAQTANYGYVPNPSLSAVFMAVAMDLPDFESPHGAIHPRFKEDVAARLALAARAVAYGDSSLDYQGPFPSRLSISGHTLTIEYDSGNSAIDVRANTGFEVCCGSTEAHKCTAAEWKAVSITAHDQTTVTMDTHVCSGQTHVVAGVRYAWHESPCAFMQCAVYGKDNGLPAPTFVKQAPFN
ncbi:sialate O-acetylesterase-like [Mya arenaria]|uniref:sialate O-acetylesterase-like n=1 Tax=Mya arenaria TaxID=6604 RepID=UPI0022E12EF7|nr:sialate O-acetylesterase-like [Mya arenaria]